MASGGAIDAERVDFIAAPVRDPERAARFYEETLGLPSESENDMDLIVHRRFAPSPDGRLP